MPSSIVDAAMYLSRFEFSMDNMLEYFTQALSRSEDFSRHNHGTLEEARLWRRSEDCGADRPRLVPQIGLEGDHVFPGSSGTVRV